LSLHDQKIIINANVAELYGIETKQVNQVVKNNPEKFPNGYLFGLDTNEKNELVKILTDSKNSSIRLYRSKGFRNNDSYY
jgi:hypothetical protein